MPKTTDNLLPEDPIAALRVLAGQRAEANDRFVTSMTTYLVEARIQHRFEDAVEACGMSRTAALKLTREWNEKGGRSIRWSDGLDPVNSSFGG